MSDDTPWNVPIRTRAPGSSSRSEHGAAIEADAPQMAPIVPGFVVGRLLGRGGSSCVWLVTDDAAQRFALKIATRPLRPTSTALPWAAPTSVIRTATRAASPEAVPSSSSSQGVASDPVADHGVGTPHGPGRRARRGASAPRPGDDVVAPAGASSSTARAAVNDDDAFHPDAATGDHLLKELWLLQRLEHPHLVRVHRIVDTDQGRGLLMDLASGGSVLELVTSRGPLPLDEVVTILVPVAQALGRLHEVGAVHGDVTPGNILLTNEGKPLLADLGTGRLLGSDPVSMPHTPGFADPSAGNAYDAGVDVFALAALAWFALTGRVPGPTDQRPPLALIIPDVPTALMQLVEDALSSDRERRPSAASFARILSSVAAPGPVDLVPTVHPSVLPELLTRRSDDRPPARRTLWRRAVGLVAGASGRSRRRRPPRPDGLAPRRTSTTVDRERTESNPPRPARVTPRPRTPPRGVRSVRRPGSGGRPAARRPLPDDVMARSASSGGTAVRGEAMSDDRSPARVSSLISALPSALTSAPTSRATGTSTGGPVVDDRGHSRRAGAARTSTRETDREDREADRRRRDRPTGSPPGLGGPRSRTDTGRRESALRRRLAVASFVVAGMLLTAGIALTVGGLRGPETLLSEPVAQDDGTGSTPRSESIDEPAPDEPPTGSSAEVSAGPPPATTPSDPVEALDVLVALRTSAFTTADPDVLAAVDVQDSPAMAADREAVESLEQAGLTLRDLSITLRDAEQLSEADLGSDTSLSAVPGISAPPPSVGVAVIRATAQISSYTEEGEPEADRLAETPAAPSLTAAGRQELVFVLWHVEDGWRIHSTVEPAS